ncbi:MAG: CoA pyrophosphatase [Thermosipho sp. (in: Bacteria)]|nr:CoA pyrophosphatase [Thermosipho sp. (in: thermotogales)]
MLYFENGFLEPTSEYSVIIPIINNDYFLFEMRSKNLKIQPYEASFPGGKIEDNEEPLKAAIREFYEELGVKPKKIYGKIKSLITPFNMVIHPYIAELEETNFTINKNEVEYVFKVPIDFFKTPKFTYNVDVEIKTPQNFPYHLIPNGKNYNWRKGKYKILFYEYKNTIIWGITARLAYEAYLRIKRR